MKNFLKERISKEHLPILTLILIILTGVLSIVHIESGSIGSSALGWERYATLLRLSLPCMLVWELRRAKLPLWLSVLLLSGAILLPAYGLTLDEYKSEYYFSMQIVLFMVSSIGFATLIIAQGKEAWKFEAAVRLLPERVLISVGVGLAFFALTSILQSLAQTVFAANEVVQYGTLGIVGFGIIAPTVFMMQLESLRTELLQQNPEQTQEKSKQEFFAVYFIVPFFIAFTLLAYAESAKVLSAFTSGEIRMYNGEGRWETSFGILVLCFLLGLFLFILLSVRLGKQGTMWKISYFVRKIIWRVVAIPACVLAYATYTEMALYSVTPGYAMMLLASCMVVILSVIEWRILTLRTITSIIAVAAGLASIGPWNIFILSEESLQKNIYRVAKLYQALEADSTTIRPAIFTPDDSGTNDSLKLIQYITNYADIGGRSALSRIFPDSVVQSNSEVWNRNNAWMAYLGAEKPIGKEVHEDLDKPYMPFIRRFSLQYDSTAKAYIRTQGDSIFAVQMVLLHDSSLSNVWKARENVVVQYASGGTGIIALRTVEGDIKGRRIGEEYVEKNTLFTIVEKGSSFLLASHQGGSGLLTISNSNNIEPETDSTIINSVKKYIIKYKQREQ